MKQNTKYKAGAVRTRSSKKGLIMIIMVSLLVGFSIGFLTKKWTSDKKDIDSGKKSEDESTFQAGEIIDYQKEGILKLGTYKGRTISVEPTDEDIETELDSICEELSVTKNHIVKKGDKITIDFNGTIDGVAFDGGSGEDYTLKIGDKEFLDDFENGLIGCEVGKTVTVNVKFPGDYHDIAVAGKTAKFAIKLKSYTPDMDDKLIAKYTKNKHNTVSDYIEQAKKDLKKDNIESLGETAWDELREDTDFKKLPKAIVKTTKKDITMSYENFAELQEQTVEELMEAWGMTEEDIEEMADERAQDFMMGRTIASIEGLVLDDDFYKTFLVENLEISDSDAENETIFSLENDYKEGQSLNPKDDALVELVKKFIASNTKIN